MVQAFPRAALSGPTLVRLLAQLTDADVAQARQSLPDRLSQWLGWTDAIALSTALNSEPPAPSTRANRGANASADSAARDEASFCASVRSALTKAIVAEGASGTAIRDARASRDVHDARRAPVAVNNEPPTYADYRHRYLTLQQKMETEIGQLRARLRALVAAKSAAHARLAAVDAIMERSLQAREHNLFASIPATLGAHFERLRAAQSPQDRPETPEPPADNAPAAPADWLAAFRQTLQSVLLAELEVRFQPVEGLLAVLRAR